METDIGPLTLFRFTGYLYTRKYGMQYYIILNLI